MPCPLENRGTQKHAKTFDVLVKNTRMGIMDDVKKMLALLDASEEEKALVAKAARFAQEKHKGQTRFSGEPYFVHLYETARELTELGMGPHTVAAGFLHDTLEDAEVSPEELAREFGPEIVFLVQGVTKLGHLRFRGAVRHAESLRRLFVATSQDMRVLIIKLADRLHNMRTLAHIPKKYKRTRIAKETLEIYAPIADRLGMGRLKRELEDLAFRYVNPAAFKKMQALIETRAVKKEEELAKCLNILKKALAENGITRFRTEYRIKGLYSLFKKLERKNHDITNIHDILAVRIIVEDIPQCYRVLGVVHSLWKPLPGKIKDYIAFPKPNGYQSLHTTVLTDRVGILEIQIRTEAMHREAQYGIASHFSYKQVGSRTSRAQSRTNRLWYQYLIPSILRRSSAPQKIAPSESKEVSSATFTKVPQWLREIGETCRGSAPRGAEFVEELKNDFFSHRVFVFTPHGDVIDLPIDSSPIDFAYAVHTDIGNHIAGAKVNGKFCSLDTKLKNGDIVEIETKPSAAPTQKWLDYAKTNLARRHINSYLQKQKESPLPKAKHS